MSLAATLTQEAGVAVSAPACCRHCATPLGTLPGPFCCAGCAGAYALIRELGLGRYYERRTIDPTLPLPRPEAEAETDLAAYVGDAGDGVKRLNLLVEGLHCAACVWLIETALQRRPEIVPEIIEARVNLTSRRLRLAWRGDARLAEPLVRLVTRLGYRVAPFDPACLVAKNAASETELLRALAVAGFAASNIMLLSVAIWAGIGGEMGTATRDLLHWFSALIALPAVAYAGRPFFRSAVTALRAGRTNMDVPISIGVLIATAMSLFETVHSGVHAYFDSAVTLLFFLLVGRYLDHLARGKARSAAEHLIGLAAAPATLLGADGETRRVPAASLAAGDMLLVAAGERIAADGRVASGRSSVDKSLIDGESLPAEVEPGSAVYAGMLNLAAPLRIAVAATGERTLLAEIVRLVEAAEQGRARYVVLADRIARRYAPAVHLLALATFLGWIGFVPWQGALLNAVAVLIITCPCALGLAVPVVQVIASNRLMRRGILLRSATALERLAEIDTVVLDKTGTLTLGRPELVDGGEDTDALALAAGLAAASRHPLSMALHRAAPDAVVADGVTEIAGQGLSLATAQGDIRLGNRRFCGVDDGIAAEGAGPELWLSRPGMTPHRFTFADALRPDAVTTIGTLRKAGKCVLLLSGDRASVVAAMASAVGIEEWRAEMNPAEKSAALAALAAAGRKTLMVGDGLNDAPALASAHVSMSPSSAADVSQVAADIVFQGASLAAVTEAIAVARRSGRLVRENILLAILYNFFAVPLAMVGLVTPLLAAVAMSSSSLIVVGNALRLGRRAQGTAMGNLSGSVR